MDPFHHVVSASADAWLANLAWLLSLSFDEIIGIPSSKGSPPGLPLWLSSRSETGVKAAKRRGAKRRGTRVALTLRPSGDYLAQTSVFGMQSSRERRHYIRSVGFAPGAPPASSGRRSP
jgi:hypothetical protein